MMNPSVINTGLILLSWPMEVPSKIGRRGNIQGAPTVNTPARKAMSILIMGMETSISKRSFIDLILFIVVDPSLLVKCNKSFASPPKLLLFV